MTYPPPPPPQYPPGGSQPPYGQPQPYRRPPPQRMPTPMWVWFLVGTVVLGFVATLGVAALTVDDPKQPSAEFPLPAGLAPVRDGDLQFTLTKVEIGATEFGGDLFGEEARGEFIVISVDVLNVGDKSTIFRHRNQTLIDDQGREYEGAAPGISGREEYNPGLGSSVQVAFDVPEGTVPAAIEFSDDGFGSGTRMELR